MTFNPNIPRPTDLLSNSQGDLLANNGALNSTFSRNHIPLNVATNNGKHSFVELVFSNPVGSPPAPPLSSGGGTVYTKSVSSKAQLFFSPGSSGNQYQLTATDQANFSTFADNTTGWTFLPGGLILQYGKDSISTIGSATTITFPYTFPSNVFSITFACINTQGNSPTANNIYVKDGSVTTSQFKAINSSSGGTTEIYWMAIGK